MVCHIYRLAWKDVWRLTFVKYKKFLFWKKRETVKVVEIGGLDLETKRPWFPGSSRFDLLTKAEVVRMAWKGKIGKEVGK